MSDLPDNCNIDSPDLPRVVSFGERIGLLDSSCLFWTCVLFSIDFVELFFFDFFVSSDSPVDLGVYSSSSSSLNPNISSTRYDSIKFS